MEVWLYFAFLSVIFSGLVAFIQKISAVRAHESNASVIAFMFSQLFFSFVLWGITGFSMQDALLMSWLAAVTGVIFAIVFATRATSLRYMDATIYFPIYKVVGPVLVLLAGIFLFSEQLSLFEWIGILMGITVPLLLISKVENLRQNNLSKGLLFLMIGVTVSAVGAVFSKLAAETQASIFLYIFIQSLVGILWLFASKRYSNKKQNVGTLKKLGSKEVWLVGLINGIINTIGVYVLLKAFESGPISIVYTINSFYILIPIILSMFFFKEHVNLRKIIAIILSIVSIFFFQF